MAETIYCDLCGTRAIHVVTKEFGGVTKNFCCQGCLRVYEFMQNEGLAPEAAEGKFFNGDRAQNPECLK